MYAFVAKRKVEFFDNHLEAFTEYNNSKQKTKGVFDIRGNRIVDTNISANHFDGTYNELMTVLKEALKEEQDERD